MMAAIDNGHGLEAETLHVNLGGEQEAVVEVVEEHGGIGDDGAGTPDVVLLQEQAKKVLPDADLFLQARVVHTELL